MGLTFQEKSLWVMLLSLAGAFGFYFANVLPAHTMNILPWQVVLFGLAVTLLVMTQIAGQIVIAIADRRSDPDERDRLIALKGARIVSYVLATGAFFALSSAVLTEGNFVFAHVLLGFWVAAQMAEAGSQLYLNRRGS